MSRLAALLGALGLAACAKQAPPPPPPPQVSVATPLARRVTDWDDYVGRFQAIDDVEVRARVSGTITQVLFRDGQDVRKGAPLFVIDPRPYQALLAQAQAQVTSAQATLTNARTVEARAKSLFDLQAVSREEYEQRQADVRTAAAALASAQANVRARALDVSFTRIVSPINGRVSDRRVSPGSYVAAGTDILTRVVTVDPIWFEFEGSEAMYLKYMRQAEAGTRRSSRYAGNPVDIGLSDQPGYPIHGRMTFVDNAVDPSSGTIRAHALVANPDKFLTPGMFGRARLLGSGSYGALLIPDDAISTDQTRKLAYVVGTDNVVAARPVEVGPEIEGLRVVRAGLAPTDLVVMDGLTRVQPGAKVTPKRIRLTPRAADTSPAVEPATAPPAASATPAGAR